MTFGNGAKVLDAMPREPRIRQGDGRCTTCRARCPAAARRWSRGFIAAGTSCGRCPAGTQSGLRVIVLFTDGASNSVPGNYDAHRRSAKALRTCDFPKNAARSGRPDLEQPADHGSVRHADRRGQPVGIDITVPAGTRPHDAQRQLPACRYLPATSCAHAPSQRRHSDVVPAADGHAEGERRRRRSRARPAQLERRRPAAIRPRSATSTTRRATSLEIIANAARNDTGDYQIRIYTIGMGDLVPLQPRHDA